MRISVITVCKNAAATIGRTIRSVLAQDWFGLEYLIVDGHSSDGTLEVVERFQGRPVSVICEPDSGISEALNKGLARASGDLIICLNADDVLADGALSQLWADWESAGRPDVLCGAVRYLDPETKSVFKELPNLGHLHRYMSVYHPSMAVTQDAYKRVGPYRDDYKLAMDCEWIHRAIRLGLDIKTSENAYSLMSLQGVSDRRFKEALQEFRRSAREHGIHRPSTDLYYCQQLAFKSMMKMRWFKTLKYWMDASRGRKEWSVAPGEDMP